MAYNKRRNSKLKNTPLVAIKSEKDNLEKEENNKTSGILNKRKLLVCVLTCNKINH